MKASYRWLRELVGPRLTLAPAEVAAKLTGAGLEVEAQSAFGAASVQVIVGRVVGKEPHPTKSKLTLVTVEAGDRTQRVVCGAPNVPEPGGLVVLAPLGTHLPAVGMTLVPREIAGVVSEGMLCSEAELGLRISAGGAGILVLPEGSAQPGQRLADAIPESSDVIFEIGLTPNRPDGLGHIGLARELAALCEIPFEVTPKSPTSWLATDEIQDAVSVTIEDVLRCPTYGTALVRGVTVKPSPLGVQYRLEALGIRAISNVVDVTNLVMMKYGHPIHAFDLERVAGAQIIIRRAKDQEKLTTLDEVARTLVADDLVIADGEKPVALAGVMGGRGSGIEHATSHVLIECAYFASRGVRRSARRHAMHSESSHRFERGVDPSDVLAVLQEAMAELCELAGGSANRTTLMVGPGVADRTPIRLRQTAIDELLGVHISLASARGMLERLGCQVSVSEEHALSVVAPAHRPDLTMEADLVEEVMRLFGVDRIPTVVPAMVPQLSGEPHIEEHIVRAAVEVGLSQALLMAFCSRQDLAKVGAPEATFCLQNPLGEERVAMRTSLLPGLLDAERRARRHGVSDVRLFATGAVFLPGEGKLANEARRFAAVLSGRRDAVLQKREPLDIYDAKGVVVALLERALGRDAVIASLPREELGSRWHPRAAGAIFVEGRRVGTFGALHPRMEQELDLEPGAFVIELDLDVLNDIGVRKPRFKAIPALPPATRDLALVVHDDVLSGQVEGAIREVGGDILEHVSVFDLFRGGSVPKEHRSLAFHLVYRDPLASSDPSKARTLTDAEVDARHQAVLAAVSERFGAALRG